MAEALRSGLGGGVATALSGILVVIGQAVILMTFGLLTLDLPLPANPLTMMLTMVLGAPVLAALAAALSGVTRSSEAAMSTTMPSPMILLATPGVLAPPGALPQSIEAVGEYLPLQVPTTRSVPRRAQDRLARPWRRRRRAELPGGIVDALPSLGMLTSWLVLALLATKHLFRWEPRHM